MASSVHPIQCPNCGANLQVNEGIKQFYCTYCGTQLKVDDNHVITEQIVRNIDEAAVLREQRSLRELEDRINNRGKYKKPLLIALLVFLLLLAGFIVLRQLRVIKPAWVKPPARSEDAFVGLDFAEVKESFWKRGFENIQLLPLNDLKDEKDKRMNTVSSVTVKGDHDYITYHLLSEDDTIYHWNDLDPVHTIDNSRKHCIIESCRSRKSSMRR